MISKELLKEILGIEILSCKSVRQSSIIRYKFDANGETRDSSINIYELSYLCKKWAYTKNYLIDSCFNEPRSEVHIHWMSKLNKMTAFSADSEPQSVFKACEWILDSLRRKDDK